MLALLGLLLTIALPAYEASQRRARRTDARAALLETAARQEQYRLEHGRYTLDLRPLGYRASPRLSERGYYRVAVRPCSGSAATDCYRLEARPVPGAAQAADLECATFFLDARGRRGATGTRAVDCW